MLKKSRKVKRATNTVYQFPAELVERNKRYLETLNQKQKLGKTYSQIEQQIDQGLVIQRDDNRTDNEKLEDKLYIQKRLQEIVNNIVSDNVERSKLISRILQSDKSDFVIRFAPQIIKTIKENYDFVDASLANLIISNLQQNSVLKQEPMKSIYGNDYLGLEGISESEVSLDAEDSSEPTIYVLDDEDMMSYNLKSKLVSDENVSLYSMTKKDLISYANRQNIKIVKSWTKPLIIDAIIKSGAIQTNPPRRSVISKRKTIKIPPKPIRRRIVSNEENTF